MNAKQLIEKLSQLPQDIEVYCLLDGGLYTGVQYAWLSKGGDIVLADYGSYTADNRDRPFDAPDESIVKRWSTPKDPREDGGCECTMPNPVGDGLICGNCNKYLAGVAE